METIAIAVEAGGNSKTEAIGRIAQKLNALIGERVPGYEGYVASKVLSVSLEPVIYDGFLEFWESYALAVVAVKPLL